MRLSALCIRLALVAYSLALPAFPQAESGTSATSSVLVVVSDSTGARVPDADVQIEGPVDASEKTQGDGSIRLTLPYGGYTVAIAKAGFESVKRSWVVSNSSESPILSIVLQVGHYCDDCCDGCVPAVQPTTSDLAVTLEDRHHEKIEVGDGPMILSLLSGHAKFFNPCSAEKTCVKIDRFDLGRTEENRCPLIVRNGDGQGNDEVQEYQVFINGKLVASNAGRPAVEVHLRKHNTVKAILVGKPASRLLAFLDCKLRDPN